MTGYGFIVAGSTNLAISRVGANVQITFGLASGALYRVQATTNLLLGLEWTNITSQLTNRQGASITYTNSDVTPYRLRAYRIVSP